MVVKNCLGFLVYMYLGYMGVRERTEGMEIDGNAILGVRW